jgi:hypothetical protein
LLAARPDVCPASYAPGGPFTTFLILLVNSDSSAHRLPPGRPGSSTTGCRNRTNNVKEYRFVKTYPAKTRGNHSQSGKPSHCPARTRLLPYLAPRIPRMGAGISRSATRTAGDLLS